MLVLVMGGWGGGGGGMKWALYTGMDTDLESTHITGKLLSLNLHQYSIHTCLSCSVSQTVNTTPSFASSGGVSNASVQMTQHGYVL